MEIDFTVQMWREGGQYVAHALPIDVMSSGPTPEAARLAADEAVLCFLRTAIDEGTLVQVLEECGYQESETGWKGPRWVGVEHHALQIPA